MTKVKLTKSNLAISALLMLIHMFMLALIVFISLLICEGDASYVYFTEHITDMMVIIGAIILLNLIMYFYAYFEYPTMLASPKKLIEIFILTYLAIILCILIGRFVHFNARPFTFFALITATLYGRRNASFFNVLFALLLFVIDLGFSPITVLTITENCANLLLVFCSGMVGIFLSRTLKTRVQCIIIAVVLLIPIFAIIGMLEFANVDDFNEMLNLFMYGAMSSVFSVMLYIFFLPIFEAIFSELTVFRLRELTSDDSKLIRKMKNEAMGTYNHSVTVAQMTEACAREIGEDAELARAAAFYHDVGKLTSPEMFTENQRGENPHNHLTPELSVDIIRSHTRDGAKAIKKQHLPEFFADVAVQHHGTMPIKYFYAKALKMSDGELNKDKYSYLGPKPESKIAAIIMIVDSVEAAARSMPNRSPEKVEELVRNIIEERLDMDQFDNCNITMKDLTVIRETLVSQITGVYHTRISYPKLKITH